MGLSDLIALFPDGQPEYYSWCRIRKLTCVFMPLNVTLILHELNWAEGKWCVGLGHDVVEPFAGRVSQIFYVQCGSLITLLAQSCGLRQGCNQPQGACKGQPRHRARDHDPAGTRHSFNLRISCTFFKLPTRFYKSIFYTTL